MNINSRLVVDEDELKWGTNGKEGVIIRTIHENVRSKTPRCRTLIHSSDISNDALMHREGLKG